MPVSIVEKALKQGIHVLVWTRTDPVLGIPEASSEAQAGRKDAMGVLDSPAVGNEGRACFVRFGSEVGVFWIEEVHPAHQTRL